MLLELTGSQVSGYYEALDLREEAIFPVDWTGETTSRNWMHLAREYTEKWHHQQQIRDTIGDATILNKQYFTPLIDTFMPALPHTFREVTAEEGVAIKVVVTSDAWRSWWLVKEKDRWKLID